MNSAAALAAAVVIGLLAGTVFFGGLYLTTRAIPTARRPGLLVAGSFASRLAVILGGAWFAASTGGLPAAGLYMAMVIAVRMIAVRLTRRRYETNA